MLSWADFIKRLLISTVKKYYIEYEKDEPTF